MTGEIAVPLIETFDARTFPVNVILLFEASNLILPPYVPPVAIFSGVELLPVFTFVTVNVDIYTMLTLALSSIIRLLSAEIVIGPAARALLPEYIVTFPV